MEPKADEKSVKPAIKPLLPGLKIKRWTVPTKPDTLGTGMPGAGKPAKIVCVYVCVCVCVCRKGEVPACVCALLRNVLFCIVPSRRQMTNSGH